MALNARKVKHVSSGPKAPALDEGAYPARLVQLIDLGVQPQEYAGEKKAPKNELMITYEFTDEFMPDEDGNPDESKPRWLSERFPLNNLDSDKAKSTIRYYALDPKEEEEGEWPNLIGRPVLVTVTKKKTENGDRNYIGGTAAPREKDAAKYPKLVNEPRVFLMDDPDVEVFKALPDWIQDIIKGGLEYEGSKLHQLLSGNKSTKKEEKIIDDEIPPFDNTRIPKEDEDGSDW